MRADALRAGLLRSRRLEIVAGAVGLVGLVVLGAIAHRPGALPLLAAGLLLVVDVVLVRWSVPRTNRGEASAHRVSVLVAASWVAIAFLPVHDFSRQSTQAAVSSLSLQTGGELVLFGVVGGFAVLLLRTSVPLVPIGVALTVLPVWVLASASWAETPAYAVARALEYVAMALLAFATAGLAVRRRAALDEVVTLVLRWTARLTVGMVLLGVALGPLFVVVTRSNRDRFTWMGAHPTESGFVLGAAILVLVSTSSTRLRMPGWMRAACLLVTAVALYENQTRTVLAGLVLGGAVLLLLEARRRPDAAALSGFFVVGGSLVAVLVAGGALRGYVLRGDDSSRLTTLNGRSDLWSVGFDALTGPMDWVHGLGYGATRVVFVDEFAFAGNAHNSVLGTLVGLGVVGVALLLVAVVKAAVVLWRSGVLSGSEHGATLAALLAYSLVAAVTSDNLAEPHFGLVVLFLCTAVGAGWRLGIGPGVGRGEEPAPPVAAGSPPRSVDHA